MTTASQVIDVPAIAISPLSIGPERWRRLLGLICLLFLTACDLPATAPVQGALLHDSGKETRDYMLVSLTRETVAIVAEWPVPGSARPPSWPPAGGGQESVLIHPGDRLDIAIWDNDPRSLLAAEGQKAVNIPGVPVSAEGEVFLPYLDEIELAGMPPDKARRKVQSRLSVILSAPQVQLNVTSGRRNMVDMLGGVAQAGAYPLPEGGLTALNLISLSGGAMAGLETPQLRVLRAGRSYGIALARLVEEPGLDIVLRGGDQVLLEADPRHFIALGASGHQDLVAFGRPRLSALEAVSRIGGVSGDRGTPRAVLILRAYPPDAVDPEGARGPDRERVVFKLDLTSTDGLFSARGFDIMPGDLVMVTESPVNALRQLLGVVGQSLGLSKRLE